MYNKIECFTIEESISCPGKYFISANHENFYLNGTSGSYNVICARLMNLSYAQYLRFCRDVLGAELIGKNHLYPIPLFKRSGILSQFLKLLNNRANLVLWERKHPDWEIHAKELEQRNKSLKIKKVYEELEELKNAVDD